jgi:hypothetical protein
VGPFYHQVLFAKKHFVPSYTSLVDSLRIRKIFRDKKWFDTKDTEKAKKGKRKGVFVPHL